MYNETKQGISLGTVSTVPVRETEMGRQFNNLTKNLEQLESVCQALDARLNGVCRPSEPREENAKSPECSTQLAKDLMRVSDRVAMAHNYLQDILNRLEI